MADSTEVETESNETASSERATAAEDIGRDEDKVTTAAQEAVEDVTSTVEAAVTKAEDAAEEVAEAVIEAADKAADNADIPELAGAIASIVIDRLRAAGLSVQDVTEEATDAAQEVAERVEEGIETATEAPTEIIEDISDSVKPEVDHWYYAWPPKFPRRRRG